LPVLDDDVRYLNYEPPELLLEFETASEKVNNCEEHAYDVINAIKEQVEAALFNDVLEQ
jgi:hypothetical protein